MFIVTRACIDEGFTINVSAIVEENLEMWCVAVLCLAIPGWGQASITNL